MTNNLSNSNSGTTFFEPSPTKLVISTALVMLLCILTSSIFIYVISQNQAKLYTDKQVLIVKKQAQLTLQPLILTHNTLSMNVYLSTLAQADFVHGITLSNAKGKLLARAGTNIGETQIQIIFSQQLAIGEIIFYINTEPANNFFNKLLWAFIILAMITALFTLVVIAYLAKKTLRDFSNQYKPLLEHRFSMELSQAAPKSEHLIIETESAPDLPNPSNSNPAISLAIVDLEPAPTTDTDTDTDTHGKVTHSNDSKEPSKLSDQTTTTAENQVLVSLLKPDTQQRMPHFKPFTNQPNIKQSQSKTNTSEIELTQSIQLVEEDLSVSSKTYENPLLRQHPHEEQLDLYSLEHQTELSLKGSDAAYLLFIDCSSGRAPIEDADEHNNLLSQYRRLVKLVINIYGGDVELLANGDIRILFDEQDANDNHGIQALCAAKLFNQLYKYYNHRQITRMQPTLNIQLALVRGNRNKMEILREESHFLTRTTLSNELISHTPLSEVKALKESLLEASVTERQEEDKILILQLNPSYQELLEKQARHLVKSI
jgi:hypothetical protein